MIGLYHFVAKFSFRDFYYPGIYMATVNTMFSLLKCITAVIVNNAKNNGLLYNGISLIWTSILAVVQVETSRLCWIRLISFTVWSCINTL